MYTLDKALTCALQSSWAYLLAHFREKQCNGAHEIASLTPPILRFGLALLCATSGAGDFHKPRTGKLKHGTIPGAANPLVNLRLGQSQTGSVLQISGNPVMPHILHKDGEGRGKPCTVPEGTRGLPLPLAQDSLMHTLCPQPQQGAGKEGL